jgi:hypothetical protein
VDDLEALRRNAILEGKIPGMYIELGSRCYVLIGEDDFFSGES